MKKLAMIGCVALALSGCLYNRPAAQPFGVTAKGEQVSLYRLVGTGGLTLEVEPSA